MVKNKKAKGNQADNGQNMTLIVQKMNALCFDAEQYNAAVAQYKAENPDIDVEAILSKEKDLLPILGLLPNRELDKFISYAKEQGTKMPFKDMEMGVLAAGRTDMQNGLAEILDSIKFDTPICPECNEKMENRGRSKKKL
jgi:hypothetical protein